MLNRGKLSINKSDGSPSDRSAGGGGAVYLHNNHANVENGRFHVAKVNSLGTSATSPGSLVAAGGCENGVEDPGQYNTYVYDTRYAKSLGQLTREALPKLDNYRDLMSVHNAHRPTLDELHNATLHEKAQANKDEESGPALKGKVIKFSWLEGVLMRCLLNIWGVMLFLRLSWVIGQAGIIEGFFVISLANLVTYITAISMSAVCTNGQIKGGGIYYMISRSLGPEFGAAIGLMFVAANSIAVSLYIVGFCESLNDLLEDNGAGFLIDGGENDVRVIGVGILVAILILAFVGMDWVTRTQMFLLVILLAAQVVFIIGTFVGPMGDDELAKGFVGYNFQTFKDNLMADYRRGLDGDDSKQSFFSVFGVFFPAVTGIVAGANLSGDLKDPSTAIPKGTLLAITITYISYFGYGIMMGGCVEREASGNLTQYLEGLNYTSEGIEPPPGFQDYHYCTSETGENLCKYGLLNSPQVMELVSVFGYLIYAGCFAATLSSAIASLVGAPRVLQALAKDELYPKIVFFAKGYGANNDPVRGYILVFLVSLGCLLIANLNAIAPLLSNFFLAAYCLINFSVFHASISKSPGWRPSFKYYNAWVSLGGSILCVAVMFLMSWITALITVAVSVFLYLFVAYRKPDVNWGSSTQAQSYNSALKSVQDLNLVDEHVKNYRPQVLVLSGMPGTRPPLVDFAYLLVKNLSLMICGHVVNGSYNQRIRNSLQKQGYNWLLRHKKKGFFALVEDDSFERGSKSLIQIAGLGKLKPNMVLLGYKHDWVDHPEKVDELMEYFNVIHAALDMHLAVGILRVPEGLDYSSIIEEEDQFQSQQLIDVLNKESRLRRNISESQFSIDSTTSTESQGAPPQIPLGDPSNDKPKNGANTIPMPSAVPAHLISDAPSGGKKRKKGRRVSLSALYQGPGGNPLPRHVLTNVTQFCRKQRKSTIDVWWLYDDGGLTMLLPYILTTRSVYSGCQLRVFTLATRKEDLGREQRNMAALLAKFRIDYSDVVVIPDITKKAQDSTKKEFDNLVEPFRAPGDRPSLDGTSITDAEMMAHKEKTNRHLRLTEALRMHSKDSTFVVMTLPMPRKGAVSGPLYMAWLEMMTKDMPPFLIVRGNQMSVLTFYS